MERFIIGLCIAGGIYWFVNHSDSADEYLPPNAPDGALEFFESPDHKMSLTLFEDRLQAQGFTGMSEGENFSIPISKIGSVRKIGSDFKIIAKDGSVLRFDLGFGNPKAASGFADTLSELLEEQNDRYRTNI